MQRKLITVVGARPQFIKAAAISREIISNFGGRVNEVIVHTGQHFDNNMSAIFFDELNIPKPKYNLEISGGTHGLMTGRMLASIEEVFLSEKPDVVLVYGDTNSTLAGALAASKLHIPIAHVEAGLRSFNKKMPEEVNRVLTDHVSNYLFCPTETAVRNLHNEGIAKGVHEVGDVMFDVAMYYKEKAKSQNKILKDIDLIDESFVLATCHRAENTDDPNKLKEILSALAEISVSTKVILPLHPRTKKFIDEYNMSSYLKDITVTTPLSFLDMIALEQQAKLIITDSGGVQKEAFFYGVPCITMRDETEWTETVRLGMNTLTGANKSNILSHWKRYSAAPPKTSERPYGDAKSARKILDLLGI